MADTPEEIGMDSKTPAVRDRVDLGHEMAGLETGRIKRFIADGASGYAADSEEKKARREHRSLLDMLLAEDPHYAALYQRVTEKINGISRAVDQALIGINQRLEASVEMLQKIRENAAELPDGTKVFHSETDGSIYTEDGQRLSDEDAQTINIPEGAPSWEDYRKQKEEHDLALRQREEIERYKQEVLDPAKDRMDDPDNPPSKDELKDIERRLEDEMPEVVRSNNNDRLSNDHVIEHSTFNSFAHDEINQTNLEVPDMSKAFDLARVDIPVPAPAPEPVPGQQTTQTHGHS